MYDGTYQSAIARAKRILLRSGFTWSVTTGRYAPYGNAQKTTKGIRVTRVGCSSTIAVDARGYYTGFAHELAEGRELKKKAIETLRAEGMAFDDRGWLDCKY